MINAMCALRCAGVFVLLSGCAGVGLVANSDPLIKLNDGEVLSMSKDRPLPTERLIQEATAIYRERDDPHGLGNSYREYGDLLRSPSVARYEAIYRRDGFIDKSITFDGRSAKATELYMKALEYYRIAEKRELTADKYDALTNVYYNMAGINLVLGAKDEACTDYDRTLQAYATNMKQNPAARPVGPKSGTIPESILLIKQRVGCP